MDTARQAVAAERLAPIGTQKIKARAALGRLVDVELVFQEPVTQAQIDTFLGLGGEITYLYRAVSYGWNGRIALSQVSQLPSLLGGSLLLVTSVKETKLHMDVATRNGRVRPVWVPGFAGNVAGFQGNTNITVAICDSGVDESHTDLNGRRVYWHDFSTDGAASPVDLGQHGSHVMGIATGTGAAGGSGTSSLNFTSEGNLSGVPSGSFYPCHINLPASPVTVTFTATWIGTGSSSLYFIYHTKGTNDGYALQGSGASGASPLTLSMTFTPSTSRVYTPALLSNGTMTNYVVRCQVSNYPGVGDGYNKFSGVAPGCQWACAKVFTSSGSGIMTWTSAALDDLVANRVADKIKVINLSLGVIGTPGLDTTTRQKVNSAVNNGVVVVVSAGNDGGATPVNDPGRAAMAITVAAANENNQLTDYTSTGFASPSSTSGQEEDYKPDVMAPGGSSYNYAPILSVDSNSGDGTAFADQQASDYLNIAGTSMASPFVAGSAALVIDALQQSGVNWDFNSSQHSRLVKMVLCATASESNTNRESGSYNPSLQRATAGPSGFPVGKDQYEGYGMLNPDAAVETVSQTCAPGITNSATLGSTAFDRRAWGRTVQLAAGQKFIASLNTPAGGDFDLYLYSATPSAYGTPVLLASSTQAGSGVNETVSFQPAIATNAFLVVKRVAGTGTFNLVTILPPTANFVADFTNGPAPLAVNFTNLSSLATASSWDFGNGNSSGATAPSFTFSNVGTFTVKLTVTNAAGTNSLTRSGYITVTNPPPSPVVAGFVAGPTNGLAPLTVLFTNLTTGATNYSWNFGDGNFSSSLSPTNTFTSAGSYTVSLTAIGPGGTNILTRGNYIVATNLPPPPVIVGFIADHTNGLAPLTVTFANLTTGATNYSWNFGDGNFSSSLSPTNPFSSAGSYTVSLTAIGPGGTNILTRANYIVATNPPPPPVIVSFAADHTNGLAPLTVLFTNLTTGATNYSWSFGDGNVSTDLDPTNAFTNAGSYTVSLTAIGPGGTNTLTRANFILATNPPPSPVIVGFVADHTNGLAPLTVVFTNLTSGATNYSWSFGDGNVSTDLDPTDVFTNAGSYTVTLTAIGPGGTNTFTLPNLILVTNLPPPPVFVDFTAAATNGLAPLTVVFTNLTTGATNYLWDFGDGNFSTEFNPTNTFTNAGNYTVTLTAAGPGGTNALTLTNLILVTAPPPPPVAVDFSADPTNGLAPLTVLFTNLTAGATNYLWDFGDGNFSTEFNPTNTFTNAGSYTVTLTAIGPSGTNQLAITNLILVTAPPPPPVVVDFSADPTNGLAPLTVLFTNLTVGATNYLWDFGDGNFNTDFNPTNTFTNPGSYTVTLTAIGPGGTNELTFTNLILVTAPPPPPVAVDFSADPTNGLAPLTVLFTNLTTGATNYWWDFGDGNFSTYFNPTNTFTNAGSYTVTLTAVGPGGTNALTFTNLILVTAPPPPPVVVDFSAAPTNGLAPLTVLFTNLTAGATNYLWDFGNGNFSTNFNPTHTFTNAGNYTVTLTAVGPGGTNALMFTNLILVTATPPPPVVVDFCADPTNGLAPLTVLFTNLTTGATNYIWDFGDGNFSTDFNPTNTFTQAGNYTVTLTAVGPGGTNELTLSHYVVVIAPARLELAVTNLDFGLLLPGLTNWASLAISNGGMVLLTGTATVDAGPWTLVSGTPFSLDPAGTTNLLLSFTPNAAGLFTNAVYLTSNGGSATNQLTGRALYPPPLQPHSSDRTNVTLAFDSLSGFVYTVQYRDSLQSSSWQTAQIVLGDGTRQVLTFPVSAASRRFYRLQVQ